MKAFENAQIRVNIVEGYKEHSGYIKGTVLIDNGIRSYWINEKVVTTDENKYAIKAKYVKKKNKDEQSMTYKKKIETISSILADKRITLESTRIELIKDVINENFIINYK